MGNGFATEALLLERAPDPAAAPIVPVRGKKLPKERSYSQLKTGSRLHLLVSIGHVASSGSARKFLGRVAASLSLLPRSLASGAYLSSSAMSEATGLP